MRSRQIIHFLRRVAASFNQSPEPTAVGAVRSAVAAHVASRRWLSFLRYTMRVMFVRGREQRGGLPPEILAEEKKYE